MTFSLGYAGVAMTVKVLVISGSMGAGKTTVLGEASDLLAARAIPHAAIDLDAVTAVLLPDDSARQLATRNLAAIFGNFVSAGIERVLLAVAVESRRDLEALSAAMSHPELVVCRLLARPETMERRIRLREPGMQQEAFVARSRALDAILNAAKVEDFTRPNDDGDVSAVAVDVLRRAGWIP
jgi:hypothetical protein